MKRLTFNGPRVRQLTDAITHPRRTWHGYLLSAELSSQSGIAKALLPRKLKEKLPALREEYEREIEKVTGRDAHLFYARMWQRCTEVFGEIKQMAKRSETNPRDIAMKLSNLAEEISGEIKRTGYSYNLELDYEISHFRKKSQKCSTKRISPTWIEYELDDISYYAEKCKKRAAEPPPVDIKSRSVFLDVFVRMPAVATTAFLAGSHTLSFLNSSVDPQFMPNTILGVGAVVTSLLVAGLATLFALDNIERFTNGWRKQKDRFFDSVNSALFSFGGVMVGLGVTFFNQYYGSTIMLGLLAMNFKRAISNALYDPDSDSNKNERVTKKIARNEMHEYKPDSIKTNLKQSWEDLDKPVALLTVANIAIWSTLAVISFSTFGIWAVPAVAVGIYASANSHK